VAAPARTPSAESSTERPHSPLYGAVIGLAALAVLLQGVWAGLFIREGQRNDDTWVTVHAHGAEVAIGLALIATIVALVQLRERKDLVVGSAVFTLLLVVEAYVGGLVGEHSRLQVIHFPLAMALLGLAVWLPLRASRRGSR
jgi:heme A synthase